MKKFLCAVSLGACSLVALAQPAAAPVPEKMATPQQSKMAVCNKDAGETKGDERKAFMKTCLSAAKETQQGKMKTCNADAKTQAIKGDALMAFM